jgi:hypothetical protein
MVRGVRLGAWPAEKRQQAAALQSGRFGRRPRPSNPEKTLDLKSTLSFSIWGWDVANPNLEEKAMKNAKERFVTAGKKSAASLTLAAWMAGGGAMGEAAQSSAARKEPERQVATVQSKFFCHTKALTPEERARHKLLG